MQMAPAPHTWLHAHSLFLYFLQNASLKSTDAILANLPPQFTRDIMLRTAEFQVYISIRVVRSCKLAHIYMHAARGAHGLQAHYGSVYTNSKFVYTCTWLDLARSRRRESTGQGPGPDRSPCYLR